VWSESPTTGGGRLAARAHWPCDGHRRGLPFGRLLNPARSSTGYCDLAPSIGRVWRAYEIVKRRGKRISPNSPFCKCRECPQREVQLWIPHSAPNGALISLDWLLAWIGCLAACLRSLSQDPVSGPCLRTLSGTLSQDPCRHESAVVQ
jgi:hypothetical protein